MIRISKQVTESLLLLLQLDAYGDSAYHKSRQLAQDLNASQDSLVKTLRILVLGGLVESSSNKNGGFRLARPVHDITLADVVLAVRHHSRFPRPEEAIMAGLDPRPLEELSIDIALLNHTLQICLQDVLKDLATIPLDSLRTNSKEEAVQPVLAARPL
jgi:DNA-binding IscR family transcriptional regulator